MWPFTKKPPVVPPSPPRCISISVRHNNGEDTFGPPPSGCGLLARSAAGGISIVFDRDDWEKMQTLAHFPQGTVHAVYLRYEGEGE